VPSTSKKQAKFMAAAAHNPEFAKKAGISQDVAKEFNQADKGKKFGSGRADLQKINRAKTRHGQQSIFKEGGIMKHSDMSKDKPMMKAEAEKAVKGHEKRMHKMAKGGVTRADGCVTKGHTKGKMVSMKMGGSC
jgi:hypothetical protein